MKRSWVLLVALTLFVGIHGNYDVEDSPDVQEATGNHDTDDDGYIPGLTEELLDEAVAQAKREQEIEEPNTSTDDAGGPQETFQDEHYKRVVPALEPQRRRALAMEGAIKIMAKKLDVPVKEIVQKLDNQMLKRALNYPHNDPYSRKHCDRYTRYRTVDGSCNNIRRPHYGASMTPFKRVARPVYADGMSAPRYAVEGKPLTNARKVSLTVFRNDDRPSMKLSHMNMAWGQFVDHDIDHGAQPALNCAGTCGLVGECYGIPIPMNDPPFNSKGVKCIQMKRDVPFMPRTGQFTAIRQQINIKTSFIDGSHLYGDTYVRFNKLRYPGKTWLLKERTNPAGGKNLLPKQGGFCRTPNVNTQPCFMSGDKRTNENQGLSSLHTLFSREHNRIAALLKKMNRHWTDDKVFLESRKIVGAELQHINYNEFLPLILDSKTRRKYGLNLESRGFYYGYSQRVDPSIFNSFAGAAYRFGHSQIRDIAHRFGRGYTPQQDLAMNRTFDPTPLYEKEGVDSIMRGFAQDASEKTDAVFAKSVQEQLVRGPGDIADLAAINIQRGREHGLPGYNTFRKFCGLKKAQCFSGFIKEISKADLMKLREVYDHPDDVDLFVGGLMEKPMRGGIMGPTFSCLLGEQFSRLREGDRFWYERYNCHTGFSLPQLQAIRRITFARVLCDNGDHIRRIQRRVLALPGSSNPLVDCSRIPRMSLSAWRESPYSTPKRRCKNIHT